MTETLEYDRAIAEETMEGVLEVTREFGVDRKDIDALLLRLKEAGCGGIEKRILKEEFKNTGLAPKFYDILQRLNDNYGGIMLIKDQDGKSRKVTLETGGLYYIDEYLTKKSDSIKINEIKEEK